MDKEQRNKILSSLSEPVRASLLDYFEEKREELSNLDTAKTWEEVLGRQWVINNIVKDLFQFLKVEKIEKIEKTSYK